MKKKFSISNMSVRAKITTFAVVMLLFMIIITAVGLFAENKINSERRDRYDNYGMGQYYLSEAYANFCDIRVSTRNIVFVYFDDRENLQTQKTNIESYLAAMNDYLTQFNNVMPAFSKEIRTKFTDTCNYMTEWVSSMNNQIAWTENGEVDKAADDLMSHGGTLARQAKEGLMELADMIQAEAEEDGERVENTMLITEIALIAVAAVAIVVAILYAVVLIKNITIPVKKLVVAAGKLAKGDVDVDCQKVNDDDLGELMDEFAEMVVDIKAQAQIADTVAKGDLTVQVNPRSDKDILGTALYRLVKDNNEILGNIKESTMQVTVGSEQVASASQSLAQGATEQASAL